MYATATAPRLVHCRDCEAWIDKTCRRHAPVGLPGDSKGFGFHWKGSYWPPTGKDDSCFEGLPKEAPV